MQGTANAFTPDANVLATMTGKKGATQMAPTYGATTSLDWERGLFRRVTTTSAIGNSTINAPTVAPDGTEWTVEIANDAGGARTITFGTNFRATATVGGTASKSIFVKFISNGVIWIEAWRSTAAA